MYLLGVHAQESGGHGGYQSREETPKVEEDLGAGGDHHTAYYQEEREVDLKEEELQIGEIIINIPLLNTPFSFNPT